MTSPVSQLRALAVMVQLVVQVRMCFGVLHSLGNLHTDSCFNTAGFSQCSPRILTMKTRMNHVSLCLQMVHYKVVLSSVDLA
jgi:hypothetical protein